MSAHEQRVLLDPTTTGASASPSVTVNGTDYQVIMYFAPEFEVIPVINNTDLMTFAAPEDEDPRVENPRKFALEVTIRGSFESTNNLPPNHVSDLQTLLGVSSSTEVTARDQIHQLIGHVIENRGPFYLLEGTTSDRTEYRAEMQSTVDWSNGIWPAVWFKSGKPSTPGGQARFEHSVQFSVGLDADKAS